MLVITYDAAIAREEIGNPRADSAKYNSAMSICCYSLTSPRECLCPIQYTMPFSRAIACSGSLCVHFMPPFVHMLVGIGETWLSLSALPSAVKLAMQILQCLHLAPISPTPPGHDIP